METAKKTFGEEDINMAPFYFEYANYFIKKMEDNVELFNVQQLVPNNNQTEVPAIQEDFDEDSSS